MVSILFNDDLITYTVFAIQLRIDTKKYEKKP